MHNENDYHLCIYSHFCGMKRKPMSARAHSTPFKPSLITRALHAAIPLMVGIASAGVMAQSSATTLPEVEVRSSADSAAEGIVRKSAMVGVLGERSLMETPFSVNVISNTLIEQQQASYLGDYLKNDPSAVVSNVPVGFLTIRGFAVGTDGFLYDGMPGNVGLSDGRGQLLSFDHIEVLKGGSAFLYGLGASSSLGGY
jgi:iron complex outermembrane recepter protein